MHGAVTQSECLSLTGWNRGVEGWMRITGPINFTVWILDKHVQALAVSISRCHSTRPPSLHPSHNTHTHTHTQSDTHTHTQTDTHIHRQTDRQTDRETERQTHAHTHTHTHTHTQSDTHTHRQTDRQTDRQTRTHTHTMCSRRVKMWMNVLVLVMC